jgi:peptidyl-prolyl cis-trans isomerase D
MSIIQTIRDKYARLAVIAVAVALVGFILIDYISGRGSSLFRGGATNLGSVNGRKIDELEFEKKVQMQEQSQQQQGSLGEEGRQQIIAALWKQQVDQILLNDEFDKLGLSVGKKSLPICCTPTLTSSQGNISEIRRMENMIPTVCVN